jgi:hypothetical protein
LSNADYKADVKLSKRKTFQQRIPHLWDTKKYGKAPAERQARKKRAGKNSFPPTPFLFARPLFWGVLGGFAP